MRATEVLQKCLGDALGTMHAQRQRTLVIKMKKTIKLILIGSVTFILVTAGVMIVVFIKCLTMIIGFHWLRALDHAARGGLLAGVVLVLILAIGEPRPRKPGGR